MYGYNCINLRDCSPFRMLALLWNMNIFCRLFLDLALTNWALHKRSIATLTRGVVLAPTITTIQRSVPLVTNHVFHVLLPSRTDPRNSLAIFSVLLLKSIYQVSRDLDTPIWFINQFRNRIALRMTFCRILRRNCLLGNFSTTVPQRP